MTVKTLTINQQLISAREEETILQAAQEAGIHIPTLCDLQGVTDVGACQLCLVEIAGSNKLQPACVTKVAEGMEVQTNSDRLQQYRRLIIHGSEIPEGMLNRVEAGIRAFDPCLSCSTHAAGQMPLHIQLVRADKNIINEVWRD
jgi:ferredoxin